MGATKTADRQLKTAPATLAWTVVESSDQEVSPTAADSGKCYRLSHSDAIFYLPTAGLGVGDTNFGLIFTNSTAGVISSPTDTMEYLEQDSTSKALIGASTTGNSKDGFLQYQLITIRYTAVGIWTVDGIRIAS